MTTGATKSCPKLDPKIRAICSQQDDSLDPVGNGIADFREAMRRWAARLHEMGGAHDEVARVADFNIPTPDGELRARGYWPTRNRNLPILIFFHGGGRISGCLESHDNLCRALSRRCGALLISVDYRLAPEHIFPAAVDDCVSATRWAWANASSLGGNADLLFVGGDSAGGSLAAVVAIEADRAGNPPIAGQILLYPSTDPGTEYPSAREFGEYDDVGLKWAAMEWVVETYLGPSGDRSDPRFAPILAEVGPSVAPALVVTAECDPIRDDGEAYARRLTEHGVKVELRRFAAMSHGFLHFVGLVKGADDAIELIAAWMARVGSAVYEART